MSATRNPRKSQARRKSQAAAIGNPQTFLERDDWMRAILAANLPDAAVRLAIAIALHLHVESGRCNPSYLTLAAESHVSERSTYRLVDLLEHCGWLAVMRTRGRQCNQYMLRNPASPMAGLNQGQPCQIDPSTLPNQKSNPAKSSTQPCQYAGSQKAEKRRKRKAGKESDSPPADLFPQNKEEAAEEERPSASSAAAARPKKDIGGGARAADDGGDAFARFWSIYPKRVAKDAARKAWDRRINDGVDPEIMIMGAQRYAIERQNQDLKYTKHPATWINHGCWEDELPGTVIDQQGNVVAVEQPPPKEGRRLTPLEMALAMDGGW